jgi:hypothetical protein
MMKEVTTTNSTEVAIVGLDDFGAAPVSSQDILIPKVLVMQKMSKLLDQDEDLKEGDLVDSLTGEKIGGLKEPLEILPFHMEKVWFKSKKEGGEFKLIGIEDVTIENENMRYSEVVNGVEYKNEMHMRFYCLRPSDMSLPIVLTFKGMSQKKGKILATQMYIKNRSAGMNQAGMVMNIGVTKEANDKGSYVVLNPSAARKSTQEEQRECLQWFKTLNQSKADIRAGEMRSSSTADDIVVSETNTDSDF